jgi:hypothetical protein
MGRCRCRRRHSLLKHLSVADEEKKESVRGVFFGEWTAIKGHQRRGFSDLHYIKAALLFLRSPTTTTT